MRHYIRSTLTKKIDLINTSLDDETSSTRWHKFLENFLEIACYLFECAFYGLVLPLIENLHKFLDGGRRLVQIFSPIQQLIPLLGEIAVLFECLFVYMSELLQTFIDGLKFFRELKFGNELLSST
jgi:hypothetical protein